MNKLLDRLQQLGVTVVLVGHSYIRCVREFMYENPQLSNLGFSDIDVYCMAKGGETLGPRRAPSKTTYRKSLRTGLALYLFILGKMIWDACCLAISLGSSCNL